ncbi:MAG: hypothetical protein WCF23_01825, partial [Candidatus Nitrosopolaris sp.]
MHFVIPARYEHVPIGKTHGGYRKQMKRGYSKLLYNQRNKNETCNCSDSIIAYALPSNISVTLKYYGSELRAGNTKTCLQIGILMTKTLLAKRQLK